MPRKRVSKEFLDERIKAAARALEACNEVDLSPVYWHGRDDTGCNWNIGVFTGHGTRPAPCAQEIRPAIEKLRAEYDIDDEG